MKIYIKWSALTDEQRKQVLSFHEEEIEKRELFEHNLNKQVFMININTGNVQFRKDF